MDKLSQYRDWIQRVLEKYSQVKPANGEIEVYKFFDHQDDHYQVFHAGWNQYRRVFGPLIHIDIIDGKIWTRSHPKDVGAGLGIKWVDKPQTEQQNPPEKARSHPKDVGAGLGIKWVDKPQTEQQNPPGKAGSHLKNVGAGLGIK